MKKPVSIIFIIGAQALIILLLSAIDESEQIGTIAGGLAVVLFIAGCMMIYVHMYKKPNVEWNRLLTAFRIQRHDFSNHLQIIYGMIQLKKYDRVLDYIDNIKKDDEVLSRIFTLKNPEMICTLLEVVHRLRQHYVDVSVEIEDNFDARRVVTANFVQMVEGFVSRLNGDEGPKRVKIILNKSRIELCS